MAKAKCNPFEAQHRSLVDEVIELVRETPYHILLAYKNVMRKYTAKDEEKPDLRIYRPSRSRRSCVARRKP